MQDSSSLLKIKFLVICCTDTKHDEKSITWDNDSPDLTPWLESYAEAYAPSLFGIGFRVSSTYLSQEPDSPQVLYISCEAGTGSLGKQSAQHQQGDVNVRHSVCGHH